jgi:poly(hydroxyalkanoate) depolymerase family esterase
MSLSRDLRIARRSMRTALRAATAIARMNGRHAAPAARGGAGLFEETGFGSNPGRLAMLVHLPPGSSAGSPLVVLLHGCGRTAGQFLHITGWAELADRLGVVLVLPEQSDENNRGRCFNWFRPTHTGRGLGEALSVRQMVGAAGRRFGTDPRRVFLAGMSAGAAMTAALLAAYPDVFAGGAAIAGLPVGAAGTVTEALHRMAEAGPEQSPAAWADLVRRAGPARFAGPWPTLSIWHGGADRVVDPANAGLLAAQWSALHGLPAAASETSHFLDIERQRWMAEDRVLVEKWAVPGLGHDWPSGASQSIADFWGLDRR